MVDHSNSAVRDLRSNQLSKSHITWSLYIPFINPASIDMEHLTYFSELLNSLHYAFTGLIFLSTITFAFLALPTRKTRDQTVQFLATPVRDFYC